MAESKQNTSGTKSPNQERKSRIHRSTQDKLIAGVCGGFAEYFNVDANVVRIVWFVAIFMGGFGLLAYILSWIIIPEGTSDSKSKSEEPQQSSALIWGLILIFIGFLFLIREVHWFDFHPFNWHHWNPFWLWNFRLDVLLPLALILFGIYYLINVNRKDEAQAAKSTKDSGGTKMQKRLTRSRTDRMLAGVCGGIAKYFDIDPSLVRIGFVLLALFAGGGILGIVAYIVMMIIIPEESVIQSTGTTTKRSSTKSKSK